MKKTFALLIAILLICGAAMAEEAQVQPLMFVENEILEIDLDGDGAQEKLSVKAEGPEYEEALVVHITAADGSTHSYETFLSYSTALFTADMNGDGKTEIFISGDAYSADYYSWCLNYDAQTGITPMLFADANRGEKTGEYMEAGYGRITGLQGSRVRLVGSQDVLGTWMASRIFRLNDGQFDFDDDGLWVMDDMTQDEEMWDYVSLMPTRSIPVTFEDGSQGKLGAGEKFMVMKSDLESIVYFQTRDGLKGSFPIQPDPRGWGVLVDGESEESMFEYLPYAD